MRCPYLNYSPAGTSFCRCGTFPGRKIVGTGISTILTKDYIERFCKNNSLDCPYNPERTKFVNQKKSYRINNPYIKSNSTYSRREELARKNISNTQKSSSSTSFFILVIIIIIIYLLNR